MPHAIKGTLQRSIAKMLGETYRECKPDIPPLTEDGRLVCHRCGAPEKMQADEGCYIQYSFIADGDKYHYFQHCNHCQLRYVWFDMVRTDT